MMFASTPCSSSGQYTGAPVARATGATAPTWSKWVWVSRIASRVSIPSAGSASSSRSASSPGSTITALRGLRAADDEAVLLHRSDGEHADVERAAHDLPSGRARCRRRHRKRSR